MLQIFFDTHKDDDTWETTCDLDDDNGDDDTSALIGHIGELQCVLTQ